MLFCSRVTSQSQSQQIGEKNEALNDVRETFTLRPEVNNVVRSAW